MQTYVFIPKTKKRSVVSVYRIQLKISKVVNNPKNNHIFTHKVVAYPKIISKNILKVVTTYQIPNTIQSQICPYHKDTLLSATHKQNNKTVRTTRTHNKVIHTTKHRKYNNFTKLSTLQYKVINTITHSIQYYILTHSKIHPFPVLLISAC